MYTSVVVKRLIVDVVLNLFENLVNKESGWFDSNQDCAFEFHFSLIKISS